MPDTDHAQMRVMSSEESFACLESVPVGRVAFIADGALQIFPVTYKMSAQRVVFRSAVGFKFDAAEMGRNVAFEADDWDDASREGWSVVVRGPAHTVTDASRLAELEALGLDPWLSGTGMQWIEIPAVDISGRRLPH